MPRLAQLLELTEEEAEKHVCDMVVAGSLWCRIDRLQGVATFQVHTYTHTIYTHTERERARERERERERESTKGGDGLEFVDTAPQRA
jgi:hypothetical protein